MMEIILRLNLFRDQVFMRYRDVIIALAPVGLVLIRIKRKNANTVMNGSKLKNQNSNDKRKVNDDCME